MKIKELSLAGLLLLAIFGGLTFAPIAMATACDTTEYFEDDQIFGTAPTSCWYVFSRGGTTADNLYVVSTQSSSPTHSLQSPVGTAASPQFPIFTFNSALPCVADSIFDFKFRMKNPNDRA